MPSGTSLPPGRHQQHAAEAEHRRRAAQGADFFAEQGAASSTTMTGEAKMMAVASARGMRWKAATPHRLVASRAARAPGAGPVAG
jgi:hypothetical protein